MRNCKNCAYYDDVEKMCHGNSQSSEIYFDGTASYCVKTESWKQRKDENGNNISVEA